MKFECADPQVDIAPDRISVYNNGQGIPIRRHKIEKVYVPELVFGHLLTGSNFDDDEGRVTGGRMGYGAKLANIFSNRFEVETCDEASGLHYRQTWENNMGICHAPEITATDSKESWTKVSFVIL